MQESIDEYRRVAKTRGDDLTNDSFYADELQHTGKLYLRLRQFDKAEPFYREALSIYKR